MMPDATIGKSVRRLISVPVRTRRSTYQMHIMTHSAAMHSNRNIVAPFIIIHFRQVRHIAGFCTADTADPRI